MTAPQQRINSQQSVPDIPSVAAIEAGDERWFRAVADYTNDWESWHGPDGQILWVNPAVERLTGFSVVACLAMPDYPLPIVAPDDRPSVAVAIATALTRTPGESLDFRIISPNGLMRWMSLSWQPMYAPEGSYLGYRTSVRDVTERRNLREQIRLHAEHLEQLVQERTDRVRQLEQRQRQMEKAVALGQLAAGVAHEINNPLAGMRNAFELIKSTISPEHEHFELLGLIDREIERISAITHQMHQLYRRAPQQPCEFSITQTVREVIHMLASTADSRQVRFDVDVPVDSVRVQLVEGEVKQVLYNLIRNAIQASPLGGEVSVRLRHRDRNIVLSVEDRGPGVGDDVLPRIFDPFFTTKHGDAQPGMGLGLSVSRNLIEAMGGCIEVISKPGQGSLFSAIFPQQLTLATEAHDE